MFRRLMIAVLTPFIFCGDVMDGVALTMAEVFMRQGIRLGWPVQFGHVDRDFFVGRSDLAQTWWTRP